MAQKLSSKKVRLRKRIYVAMGVVVFLGVIASFLYIPFFAIQGMDIQGVRHTDVVALQQGVQPLVESYRYMLIPNNHVFLYQKKNIEKFILQTYPSVETVDMHIDTSRKLIIRIKDRKPLGVWCTDECYLYDTSGVLFKKSFKYTGALFVSWTDMEKKPVHLLEIVACKELCTNTEFMDFLNMYRIEKATIGEQQLELMSADGYTIKTGFVASSTMTRIRKVVDNKPELLKGIEYLDVRFENKVFYKEKGE
jgi:cell division septal protein FtsQ